MFTGAGAYPPSASEDNGFFTSVTDLAVGANGEILVAGITQTNNGPAYGVLRFFPSGEIDSTFQAQTFPQTDQNATTVYLAVNPTDGGFNIYYDPPGQSGTTFTVIQCLADGSLDSSFGTGGTATITVPGDGDIPEGLGVDPTTGEITLTASTPDSGQGSSFVLARLDSQGNLDTSFGNDGVVTSTQPISVDSISSVTVSGDTITVGGTVGDTFSLTSYTLNSLVPASSSVTLTATSATSSAGQSVTLTATVAGVAADSVPTGTVTFLDGTTTLGTGSLIGSAQATFTTVFLTVGPHSLTAVYGGDMNFQGGTSAALMETVNPYTAFTPPAGLVGWWTGNDTTKDVVNGQDAMLQGLVTYGTGKAGQAFSFNNSSDEAIVAPDSPSLDLTTVTVGAWIQLNSLPSDADYAVLTKGLSYGSENYGLYVDMSTGSPRLLLEWYNNGFQQVTSDALDTSDAPDLKTGAFHYVAVTVAVTADGTADGVAVCFYLDGQLVGEQTKDAPLVPNNGVLQIGRAAPYGNYFDGLIGDVEVYNRALSANDIQYIYAANSAGTDPSATSTVSLSTPNTTVLGGEPIPLTATVAGTAGGSVPTGIVTFFDGTTVLGAGTLDSNGEATISAGPLGVGSHSLTAVYTGDSNYQGSTSSALAETVTQPTAANLDTVTWENVVNGIPTGGDWEDASNWVDQNGLHFVPVADDAVVIPIPYAGITITHLSENDDSVFSLISQADMDFSAGSLSLAAASTIDGALTLDGGTLTGVGDITVAGPFASYSPNSLSGSGTVYLDGTAYIRALDLDQPLINEGDLTFWDGTIDLGAGVLLTNAAGATFEMQEQTTITGDGTFTNDGILLADQSPYFSSYGGQATISVYLDNQNQNQIQGQGMVHAANISLSLQDGGSSSGTFQGDAGTGFGLNGNFTFAATSVITADQISFVNGQDSVAGSFQANETTVSAPTTFTGTVQSLGALTVDAQADLSNATLARAAQTLSSLTTYDATLLISGNLTVTGDCSIANSTVTAVDGPAALTAQAGGSITNGTTLDGYSLVNPAGQTLLTGDFTLLDGATLTNDGTIDAYGTLSGDSTAVLNNYGFLVGLVNDPTFYNGAAINVALNNYHVINVQEGRLDLGETGTSATNFTGSSVTGASGTLLVLYGPTTFQTGSTLAVDAIAVDAPATFAGSFQANETNVGAAATLATFTGTVQSLGALTVDAQADLSNATLAPAAQTLSSLTTYDATLLISGNLTVTGDCSIANSTVTAVDGPATLTAQAGGSITNGTTLDGYSLVNPAGQTLLTGDFTLLDGATLSNDGTIHAYGTLSGDSTAVLNNYGSLVGLVNDPTFYNAAAVNIALNNYGVINVQVGRLDLGDTATSYASSSVTGASGTLLVLYGPTTFDSGSTLAVDAIAIDAPATFAGSFQANETNVGAAATLATFTGIVLNLGALTVDAQADLSNATLAPAAQTLSSLTAYDATLLISGNLTVTGDCSIANSTVTAVDGPATLTAQAGGSITNGTTLDGYSLVNPAGQTLLTGDFTLLDGATLTNDGTIDAYGTQSGDSTAVLNNYGFLVGLVNDPTFYNAAAINVALNNHGVINVQEGRLDLGDTATSYAGSNVTGASGTLLVLYAPTTFQTGSTLTVDAIAVDAPATFAGSFQANSTAIVGSNVTFTNVETSLGNLSADDGSIGFLPPPLATVTATSVDLASSSLTGNGQLLLDDSGDFTLDSASSLSLVIGGPNPGSQYDQIEVAGLATLAGTLNITQANGYAPASSDDIAIIQATGDTPISGTFASLGVTPADAPFTVATLATAVQVVSLSSLTTSQATSLVQQFVDGSLPGSDGTPTLALAANSSASYAALQAIFSPSNSTPLAAPNGGTDINLTLGSGVSPSEATYAIPDGIQVEVNGGIWLSGSPALKLTGGTLVITNATFTNDTTAPTILVTGGSLTLGNDTIEQSTNLAANPPLIDVEGGAIDLTSMGPNTLSVAQNSTLNVIGVDPSQLAGQNILRVVDQGGPYTGLPFAASATATANGSVSFTYYSGAAAGGTPLPNAPTAVGTYTVVAAFTSADSAFVNATSTPVTFTIAQATTTSTIVTSLTPSVYGQSVTITDAVAPTAPGAGAPAGNYTPSGQVDFFDTTTGTDLGSVTLSGGVASLTTSALPAGSQVIVATYGGDNNFATSKASLTQNVSATPLLQNGVLAIPGAATAATFTLTPVLPTGASTYSMKVTRTIGTTTTNLGTFAVPSGVVDVYGGPGVEALTLSGTANNDAFTVGSGTVSEAAAQGTAQATIFTVGLNDVTALALKGDGGSDTLIGPNQANTWTLTGSNAGTLDGLITFTGIQNLTGGSGADAFAFGDGASVSGTIDGGAGANTLDFSRRTAAVTVTLVAGGTNKATATGGWTNIATVVGASATTNTLIGPGATNTWDVTGDNAGTLNGTVAFSGFQNLTGGTMNDTFAFLPGGSIDGNIKGGAPTNALDYSHYGSPATVNLQTKTATAIGGTWANVQTFLGTGTSDNLVGSNATNTWSITGANAGTVSGHSFAGFPNLIGGTGNNTFAFAAGGSVSGTVTGGGGTNTLDFSAFGSPVTVDLQTTTATGIGGTWANIQSFKGTNTTDTMIATDGTTNTWTLKGSNTGTVDGVGFTGFANLTGGSGNDTFMFANGATVSGIINGGDGSNTLDYSAYTGGVTVNLGNATAGLANYSATGVNGGLANGLANIDNVVIGAGNNYLTAVGLISSVSFTATGNGNNILVGGSGTNTLTAIGSGNNILIGDQGTSTINGGSGYNLLIGGYTAYDLLYADLEAILGIWMTVNSAKTYSKVIASLTASSYAYSLTAVTVHSKAGDAINADGNPDGTHILDWYFAASASEITGENTGEV